LVIVGRAEARMDLAATAARGRRPPWRRNARLASSMTIMTDDSPAMAPISTGFPTNAPRGRDATAMGWGLRAWCMKPPGQMTTVDVEHRAMASEPECRWVDRPAGCAFLVRPWTRVKPMYAKKTWSRPAECRDAVVAEDAGVLRMNGCQFSVRMKGAAAAMKRQNTTLMITIHRVETRPTP